MIMNITLPLEVRYQTGKSANCKWYKFILNLNNYRNTHGRLLGAAKVAYKELIWGIIPDVKFTKPVSLTYTYYAKTKRKIDLANPCVVIDKFACDVLVEKGVLIDDNNEYVPLITYIWGGVDNKNPRCELEIKEYEIYK